ncbi:MAG: NAD+ synthase [Euryarchaeota archaeon]|nr:NAD+ synthase [Euryarchaeota archaeon]
MHPLVLSDETLEAIAQKVKHFIETSVRLAGASGVVIALSGGVDSSVVASLAHDVVDTRALILPEKHITPKADVDDGKMIAQTYEMPFTVLVIDPLVECFKVFGKDVATWQTSEKVSIAEANLKARVRMVLAYLVANSEHRLVLGTGNKTELLTGYFTKCGDGGVDVLPIGGLYKTQVFQLARYLNIPESIVSKAPSAGLWVGQTDEDELGLSYELLDNLLFHLIDKKKSVKETADLVGVEVRQVEDICNKVRTSKHKRHTPKVATIC